MTFTAEQFERILFSDEKWFILNQSPNKKNDVCWGPVNPNYVVPCKKAHGTKIMAWVGIVDGRVLPVYCFNGSVTAAT